MNRERLDHSVIRRAVSGRTQFVELVVIALLVALGVDLISTGLRTVASISDTASLAIGIGLCLISLMYLGGRVFAGHSETRRLAGFLIYDSSANEIVAVPRYELAEDITHYLRAALAEDKALAVLWEREPVRAFGADSAEVIESDAFSMTVLVKELRSFNILGEVIEYWLLKKLSTHLTDYFSQGRFSEKSLTEYGRADIADILLSNRFLELISKPMDQRPDFVHQTLEPSLFGDPLGSQSASGALYERFYLMLPKSSVIRRGPESHDPGESRIEIETSRIKISFNVKFTVFHALLPAGFLGDYLRPRDRAALDSLEPRQVYITVEIRLKPGALLSPLGWEYYRWIDSFLTELELSVSEEAFFQRIGWESARTIVDILVSCLPLGSPTADRVGRPDADIAQGAFLVHSAVYGARDSWVDVTQLLRSKTSQGALEIEVSNDSLGGDPIRGVVKVLKVVYSYAGERYSVAAQEGTVLKLPQVESGVTRS